MNFFPPSGKICIVGGGTSAWLTAAYLSSYDKLNNDIIVVDSELGSTVEVGEATLPTFMNFWNDCGFSHDDLFHQVGATIKTGILFTNWQEENKDIWHPFYRGQDDIWDENPLVQQHAFKYELWSKNQDDCDVKYSMANYDRCVIHNKVEKDLLDHSYTVHIDCKKLVEFIQQKNQKVKFIKSAVNHIHREDIVGIYEVVLNNGETINADLYIDCTGFKSVLKEQKKVDLSDRLFCDTAIASHIPYNHKEELRPYTICDAVDHGWVWKIPLQKKFGSGLVFNRGVTEPEEAEKYFIDYWDNRITKEQCKLIDWTPYYIENFWENNVISIGLSGGFIEPLESTGIATMTMQIQNLYGIIREGWYSQNEIDLYNSIVKSSYERSIDFVNMHYSKSKKTGPFWERVKEKHNPSAMQYYYENFMKNPVSRMNPPSWYNYSPFRFEAWMCIMSQMDFHRVPKQTNFHSPKNKNIHYYRLNEQEVSGVNYPESMEQFIEKGNL